MHSTDRHFEGFVLFSSTTEFDLKLSKHRFYFAESLVAVLCNELIVQEIKKFIPKKRASEDISQEEISQIGIVGAFEVIKVVQVDFVTARQFTKVVRKKTAIAFERVWRPLLFSLP